VVELPRHVHRVIKTRKDGRKTIYTFYTRSRNTPAAWPSIRLPEPLESDFAHAIAVCEAMEYRDGEFFLFGVALPSPKDAAFWSTAQKSWKAKEARDHSDAKDFTALVAAFQNSETYKGLAKSTRRGYNSSAALIVAAWGADPVADLTAPDAQVVIDGLGDTPATANQFRAFGSRLVGWGIPRGYSTGNPFEYTEKIPGGEPWKPWPEWAFETLLEHAPFHILLPCISALFTGQRQSDILPMARPKPTDKDIEVRAQKTGSTVWIPLHSQYRPWIAKAKELYEKANQTREAADKPAIVSGGLHLGVRGLPYETTDGFRSELRRLMRTEPFKRFREERIVFHGLRKNAVNMLLEVGCTETQVGSIVNMSEEMVRHYSRDVNVRRLAKDGMKMLEDRWSEVLPKALQDSQAQDWTPIAKRR
jgi:integrase